METVIELENPGGPLGIHVMPSSDDSRRLVSRFTLIKTYN